MKRLAGLLLTAICVLGSSQVLGRTIVISDIVDANGEYADAVIKMALAYHGDKYDVQYSGTGSTSLTQLRQMELVRAGRMHVLWAGTTPELEEKLRPVRVPLYKGLLGYRIFIIRQGDQARFNGIETLAEVRNLDLGQGRTWSDTLILEANGFEITKANKYDSLFHMVDGGRFDAFPRGVNEPWGEIAARPELNLTVEKNLMLVYKMPFYLFVGPDDAELERDLESGMRQAMKDGTFDKFFFNNPMVKDVLAKGNLENRRAFMLDNPLLTPETPLDDPLLWLDPYSLKDRNMGASAN